jgi:hypothetical protein
LVGQNRSSTRPLRDRSVGLRRCCVILDPEFHKTCPMSDLNGDEYTFLLSIQGQAKIRKSRTV